MPRGLPLSFSSTPPQAGLLAGWNQLPIGGGGLITGQMCPLTGIDTGGVCRTDVAGAYSFDGTRWNQMLSYSTLGMTLNATTGIPSPPGPIDRGVWEVCVGPNNANYVYTVYGTLDAVAGTYKVYTSASKGLGAGNWQATNLTFTASYAYFINVISNSGMPRLANQKMVADPANEQVVYMGMPVGSTVTGTYAGHNGLFRSGDGGANWEAVTAIPEAASPPGYAGMVIDENSAPTTLTINGVSRVVSSHLIIPVDGNGVWESTNGGLTWSKVASDATPTSDVSITTTTATSIIVANVIAMGHNSLQKVEAISGPAGPTYPLLFSTRNQTSPQVSNPGALGFIFERYLIVTTPGTYVVRITPNDGGTSFRGDGTSCNCTNGTISNSGGTGGAVFTEGGVTTGTFAVGMRVANTGSLFTSNLRIRSNISAGVWQLDAYYSGGGSPFTGVVNGYPCCATQGVVFAVKDADIVNPFGSTPWLAQVPRDQNQSMLSGIVTTATSLIFSFGWGYAAADTGFTLLTSNNPYQYWAEISTSPVVAGTYSGASAPGAVFPVGSVPMWITDAIAQRSGGTIALDGTPQYFQGTASWGDQPANVSQGQIDATGTYWCISGPFTGFTSAGIPVIYEFGGIYRYKSGSWDRIDGSLPLVDKNVPKGTPAQSVGGGLVVDNRVGGVVRLNINDAFYGAQCNNSNAALASMSWVYSTPPLSSTTLHSTVPWLDQGTIAPSSPVSNTSCEVMDKTTGNILQCSGTVPYTITAFNMDQANYQFTATLTPGVEETIIQDICSPPGAPSYPLIAVEDLNVILQGSNPLGAVSQPFDTGNDTSCWHMDWASSDPSYVVAYAFGVNGAPTNFGGYSTNYGVNTWTKWATHNPTTGVGVYGANLAVSSPLNTMIIVGGSAIKPIFTLDNAATAWQVATWAPLGDYIQAIGLISASTGRLICADRVDANTFYFIFPGDRQVYMTRDGGATAWDGATGKMTHQPTLLANPNSGGFFILATPGHAKHVWACTQLFAGGDVLWRTTDAGATAWTNANTDVSCQMLTMGKASPGSPYPTIFIRGIVSGTSGGADAGKFGVWRSIDEGVTWQLKGTANQYSPVNSFLAGMSFISGCWNVFDRVYADWGAAGAICGNPPIP